MSREAGRITTGGTSKFSIYLFLNYNGGMDESQQNIDENQPPGQLPPEYKKPPLSPPAPGKSEDLPGIRTMKHDATRYLKDRNISFLDLVAKEHTYAKEHAEAFEYNEKVTEKVWFRSVIVLVSLVFLGILVYTAYVFLLTRDTLPTTEAPPARAFITVEEREIISIREKDRAGLLSKLEAARRDRLPSRSIKHVVVRIDSFGGASRFASARDFFETLDFKTPPGFTENINDKFDILIYYRPDGADIALLASPKDYERVFAHMLAWENTILLDFRHLYFDNDISQPLQLFNDKIVRNIDTRTIALEQNQEFIYAFFAQRLLVIATSEQFLEVILGRLLAAPPR